MVAQIKNKAGKVYKVSSANLLPVRSGGDERLLRFEPLWDLDQDEPRDDSSDSSVQWSEADGKLPPGVKIMPVDSYKDTGG
jgi:hypothetical protein